MGRAHVRRERDVIRRAARQKTQRERGRDDEERWMRGCFEKDTESSAGTAWLGYLSCCTTVFKGAVHPKIKMQSLTHPLVVIHSLIHSGFTHTKEILQNVASDWL